MFIADIQNEKSAFVQSSRHKPMFISCYDYVEMIFNHHGITVFTFNHDEGLGYERFQYTFGFFTSRPKGLVEKTKHRVLKVCVEVASHVLRII